jgi:hypothetical protein
MKQRQEYRSQRTSSRQRNVSTIMTFRRGFSLRAPSPSWSTERGCPPLHTRGTDCWGCRNGKGAGVLVLYGLPRHPRRAVRDSNFMLARRFPVWAGLAQSGACNISEVLGALIVETRIFWDTSPLTFTGQRRGTPSAGTLAWIMLWPNDERTKFTVSFARC